MITFSYNDLAALHTIARIMSKSMPLRDQLEQVLHAMSTHMGMERGMISILEMETGEAVLDVALHMNVSGISYKPGEGITGKVAESCRAMAVEDIGREALFLDRTGARKGLNRTKLSFLCVPVIYEGKAIGVLSADKVAKEVYTLDYELMLLSEVAGLISKSVHMRSLEEENTRLRERLAKPYLSSDIIGNSKSMREVFSLMAQVSDSNTTVIIQGETGTGKELVARDIHRNSARRSAPFVEVNCAAIPDTLIESELFGHEKGAFTGAQQRRKGRFEEAHGGTIFLDEVGELTSMAQAKLLRVLQERQFQPLGSSRTVKVNVRIIVATNRTLEDDVESGIFRADLYYRLNVFPIYMPPLRERGGDIILLTDYFVGKYAKELDKNVKRISTPALDLLVAYHWPGNVRELENCIERAVLLAGDDTIEGIHLPPSLQMKEFTPDARERGTLSTLVDSYERSLIVDALKDCRGNQSEAARTLGTTKRIIQYKVRKYGVDTDRFKKKK